ncbi:choice-of-anchor D domain-containing protein [Myxococcota bacterium]|nr:choice-of-anchor D domain-containing protein [Myxococcota bacterium]
MSRRLLRPSWARSVIAPIAALALATSACGDDPSGVLGDSGVVVLPDSAVVPDADVVADADVATDGGQTILDADTPDAGFRDPVELSIETLDFGAVVVGSAPSLSLTLTNQSAVDVPVSITEPSGPDALAFTRTIDAPNDEGTLVLAAGASVDVRVSLLATEPGPVVAILALSLCEGGCPAVVTLVAEVISTGLVCPTRVDFGASNPGRCTSAIVRCENRGNIDEVLGEGSVIGPGADAFSLPAATIPATIAPGEALELEPLFCPASVGDRYGTLRLTATTSAFEHDVTLLGHGGGPELRCAPSSLDFGVLGVGAEASRTITCENSGFEDGTITFVGATSADFSVDPPSAAIAAGARAELTVTIRAQTLGLASAVLDFVTDDPHAPTFSAIAIADVLDVGPCTAALVPPALDLGLVPVGATRRAELYVDNVGAQPCLVRDVTFTPGPGVGLTLADAPSSGARIEPGARARLALRYVASSAGTSTASVSLTFTNPASAPLVASVSAIAGSTALAFDPLTLDVGDVAIGCAAPTTRTVRLRNTSAQAVTLDAFELTPAGLLTLSGGPASLPVNIPPLGAITLDVAIAPTTPGVLFGELRARAAGRDPIVLPISGRASATAARRDSFPLTGPRVDLVFVVDDSATMGLAQAAFSAEIPRFLDVLRARGVDLQVGVVTTDVFDPAKSGRLQGTPAVLDDATPDLSTTLAARVAPGTNGSGTERGVAALVAALTPPLVDAENAGLLRGDAELTVVFIGDEDDQTIGSIESAIETLRAAAPGRELSIFGITGQASGSCNGPFGTAGSAPRWHELAARADRGAVWSICAPIATSVAELAARVARTPDLLLSAEPRPETIAIDVDGIPVPSTSSTGAVVWAWDPIDRDVDFTTGALPSGAALSITYDGFCLSATCGDGTVDAFEACDDGNTSDDDGCTAGCRLAICGDGHVAAGVEACDDANGTQTDACLRTCAAASCGDGFVQSGVEDCDDANATSLDGCPATCTFERTVSAHYAVGALTGATFTALANETPIALAGGDDDGVGAVVLPYAIPVFGLPTDTFFVSVDGFLATANLSPGTGSSNGTFPTPGAPDGVIAPWWEDLVVDPMVPGGASIAYEVQGTAPNRVTVIQWRGVRLANQSTASHRRFTFQVALFETTGVITFRWGSTATTGAVPTATSASVGIENLDGTAGQALLTCTPGCAGPARPGNPNGFPAASALTLTPL